MTKFSASFSLKFFEAAGEFKKTISRFIINKYYFSLYL